MKLTGKIRQKIQRMFPGQSIQLAQRDAENGGVTFNLEFAAEDHDLHDLTALKHCTSEIIENVGLIHLEIWVDQKTNDDIYDLYLFAGEVWHEKDFPEKYKNELTRAVYLATH